MDKFLKIILKHIKRGTSDKSAALYSAWLIKTELKNQGAIFPPCKIGDPIFTIGIFTGQILESKVIGFTCTENDIFINCDNCTFISVGQQLGKTVFLNKKIAEIELKERRAENGAVQ